ncbi:MAG: type IV pilus assembly protein PilM [Candidatus Omnitrophota bacterium]
MKKSAQKAEMASGIDIGNFSVKIAQMSKKEDVFTLEAVGYSRINVNKLNGLMDAIKVACEAIDLSHKKVNTSLNPENVIVRYLVLPQMTKEDLKGAMEFEIDRYVPFDKSDIVCDYMVINNKPEAKNMKVLLVAAKKQDIEERIKILKDIGLDPEVLTIDSIVLKNAFQLNYPEKEEKTIGLINIGSRITNINIIKEFSSYFMRDVQIGGDNITHLLKEKLEVNLDEAEQLKYTLDSQDKEKFKIVEPVLGNLLNEIYLSFDYYESEFGMVVDEIFLSGGTSHLVWLADFLKENLNREIAIFKPTDKILYAPTIEKNKIETLSSSLVVPIGLALESFN